MAKNALLDIYKHLPFNYRVTYGIVQDLPSLTSKQCQILLEGIVEPELRAHRAWLKELAVITKTLEGELATFKGRRLSPLDQDRRDEVRTSIRQVHDGLRRGLEGVCTRHAELLKPLMPMLVKTPVPDEFVPTGGKRGAWETEQIIATLDRDRDYLRAYIKRWPTPESTHPYQLTKERIAEFWLGDQEIRHGDIVQFTEGNARGRRGIFEPAEDLPEVIEEYTTRVKLGLFSDDEFEKQLAAVGE